MNRRDYLATIAALMTSTVTAATATGDASAKRVPARRPPVAGSATTMALIKPPILRPGALVGLIAPGGVLDDTIIQTCVRNLESLGFNVKTGANIRAARGGYAGTVGQRIDDLHGMFRDREIEAIWTARGGSGCTALLPQLDYRLIRAHPKILIGYSDITALHLAIYRHSRLVTFHGPVAWSSTTDYSVSQMQAVLMVPRSETAIHMSIENERKAETRPQYRSRVIQPGIAEGRLLGGNLSVLCAMIGTPYAAEIDKALLFLEEVGEAPYRVDRLMTQLEQSRALSRTAGVMLGVFERGTDPGQGRSLTLEEVIDEHLRGLPVPSVYGFSFGHISQQFTLPVGVRARMDTASQTVTLLESAVIG